MLKDSTDNSPFLRISDLNMFLIKMLKSSLPECNILVGYNITDSAALYCGVYLFLIGLSDLFTSAV